MNFPESWDEVTCITHLQRRILLYSIAYYEFDESPVSDYFYDELAHELVDRMRKCENVKDTMYYYAFYDYDGSTGYHLYYRLTNEDRNHLLAIAKGALNKE